MTKLDVVTGFLGAGKTTFLARYLSFLNKNHITYCIIENEFAHAGVDGEVLKRQGAKVKEISGGCVCCTLKATLYELLNTMAGTVERIILEPSGLFCGDDLMDILKTPEIEQKVSCGMWVGIVDPLSTHLMTQGDLEVLQSELMYAGSMVMSKVQLSTHEDVINTESMLTHMSLQPMPFVYNKPWDEYTADAWFLSLQENGTILRKHQRKLFDHVNMFSCTTIRKKTLFSKDDLHKKLCNLMQNASCGEILRIKGTLCCNEHTSFFINCTKGSVCIEEVAQTHPALSIIGRNMNRKEIQRILEGE